MSEAEFDKPPASGVSPARKMVSIVLLLGLLVILVIELRAGVGQSQTVSTLAALGEQGGLEEAELSKDALLDKLWFSPTEEKTNEDDNLVECEYTWYSVFQPILSGASPSVKVLYAKSDETLTAIEFKTPEKDGVDVGWSRNFGEDPDNAFIAGDNTRGGMDPDAMGAGGFVPGMNNGQVGGGGDFTQRLWQGMKRHPVMAAVNKDGDDELSAEEIEQAADSLMGLDRNKDGVLTEDELRPNGPPGGGGPVEGGGPVGGARERPSLDDE